MPLANLFQVQPDEVLGIGMRLITIDDLLAGIGVQVGRQTLLGAGGEEDLLGSQLIVNLGCDEIAGIEGAASSEAQDENHDDLQDDYAPPNGLSHLTVSFFVSDGWDTARRVVSSCSCSCELHHLST